MNRSYAFVRIAIGLGSLIAPARSGRMWLGDASGDRDTQAVVRMFGVRDALLGVGVLAFRGDPRAIQLCIAADAADAVACGTQALRSRRPGMALAAGAALTGVATGLLALRRTPAR
jgi:hypothetical protein